MGVKDSLKSAKEWGLPSSGFGECWICGHETYEGREKCHGYQELVDGTIMLVCSTCFQVQMSINKDSLGQPKGVNSCGLAIKRIFLCNSGQTRISVWEILQEKPWAKQVQQLPKRGVV